MWQQPFEELSRSWRTVTYDRRGTGASVNRAEAIKQIVMRCDGPSAVLAAKLAQSMLFIVEGAGHVPTVTRSAEVVRAINELSAT